ncbi:dihydropteroate synthase [Thiomicrorhabdus xiamenensis]|uniref:Dihydropteroate synthase n=1 Tax=Thiomicrorhabdus xiamenensis TaxID=2739063 RepID=A0A7D4T9W3_9GAMM|nr:dihydropteroate synthase [Thiomicrorhabdus xiamenensis]QKI88866.1 dihydropteroate synthase [Thiomicrorhabdus xiamenensis]
MKFDLQSWLGSVYEQKGHAAVMGILNVTPDSFSDGGQFNEMERFKQQLDKMLQDGVDILDIGGESTRPGSDPVSLQEELDRVLPAIEWVRECTDMPISIDTYHTEVMQQSLRAGADLINDINALRSEGAVDVVVDYEVPVCIMHMQGIPKTMQQAPVYSDVVAEVKDFLKQRIAVCEQAGIDKGSILIDLGFGFGKTFEDNVTLFKNMHAFADLGCEMLVGVSRKRMIAEIVGSEKIDDRITASVTAAALAAQKGAKVVRVHDVKETVQALQTLRHLG